MLKPNRSKKWAKQEVRIKGLDQSKSGFNLQMHSSCGSYTRSSDDSISGEGIRLIGFFSSSTSNGICSNR